MAIIGYARVSSRDQHLNVQLEQLNHCDRLFQEKQSGLNGDRPQLRACLEYVRGGDVLVILEWIVWPGLRCIYVKLQRS